MVPWTILKRARVVDVTKVVRRLIRRRSAVSAGGDARVYIWSDMVRHPVGLQGSGIKFTSRWCGMDTSASALDG
jgi:hypothetical protein